MQLPCDREHDMKTKFLKVSSSVSKQYEYFLLITQSEQFKILIGKWL